MFSVIFEVNPKSDHWDAYLENAKMLRPELVEVPGFVDNIRYKSLTRDGWILSLSGWRNEKAVVRWRTSMHHHMVQEKGRTEILQDYHLRVGQITQDTHLPDGYVLEEQRLDETEVGEGTAITLIDAKAPPEQVGGEKSAAYSRYLGLDPRAPGLLSWDVFDAVLNPGDLILLMAWRSPKDAKTLERKAASPQGGRLRQIRVVRDYGMFDRREAPQFYPPVEKKAGHG
jgi:heme-degrading monooxygenase HmoA